MAKSSSFFRHREKNFRMIRRMEMKWDGGGSSRERANTLNKSSRLLENFGTFFLVVEKCEKKNFLISNIFHVVEKIRCAFWVRNFEKYENLSLFFFRSQFSPFLLLLPLPTPLRVWWASPATHSLWIAPFGSVSHYTTSEASKTNRERKTQPRFAARKHLLFFGFHQRAMRWGKLRVEKSSLKLNNVDS